MCKLHIEFAVIVMDTKECFALKFIFVGYTRVEGVLRLSDFGDSIHSREDACLS